MSGAHQARILVVDDEPSIVDVLTTALRHERYDVVTAEGGLDALRSIRRGGLDLAILDVMMADLDGFAVVKRMRDEGLDLPVLFLTARTEVEAAIEGLGLGADDYVRKPFSIDELLARIAAVLRLRRATTDQPVLTFRDVRLDPATLRAHRGTRPLELSPTELRLVEVLLRNRGRVLSREQILDLVWHDPAAVDLATVDTAVSRLRRRLNADGEPDVLVTRRGVGYGFVTESGS